MKTPTILFLSLAPLLLSSCKREEKTLSYEERKKLPAETNAKAPQPPPGTGASQTDSGTRSDYKPTTGPAGQVESNPTAPPSGTNPSPANPNVTPPPAGSSPPPANPSTQQPSR